MSSQPSKKTERVRSNFKINPRMQFPSAVSTGTHKNNQSHKGTDYSMQQQQNQQQPAKFLNQQHFNMMSKNQKVDPLSMQGTLSTLVDTQRHTIKGANSDNDIVNSSNQQQFHTINNSSNNYQLNASLISNSIQDYQSQTGHPPTGGGLPQPQRINSNNRLNIHQNTYQQQQQHQQLLNQNHHETLMQYSSIPVKMVRDNSQQNQSFKQQSHQLQKLYGGNGGHPNISNTYTCNSQSGHRRFVKSVERRSKPEIYKKYTFQNQINNTNNAAGTGNQGAGHHSIDSGRLKYKMSNLQSIKSSSKNKQYIQTHAPINNFSNSPQKRQLSSIGLKSRYNTNQQQQQQQRLFQPLGELGNTLINQAHSEENFSNFKSKQSQLLHQQQQQNMHPNSSQVNFTSSINQLASGNSKSHHHHIQQQQQQQVAANYASHNQKGSNNQQNNNGGNTIQDVTTTDTMMFLKKQELMMKSNKLFEEGKEFMHSRNYKDAIKAFSQCLKVNNSSKDAKYYRAICYLDSDNTKKCISELNELIEIDSVYNQTTYIVLSIAYRRTDDLQNAIKALTRGLQKFPKYVQAYQARGQLQIYLKKWEKALIDFQNVIQLQPQLGAGYIGQADSLKGIGNMKGALQSYNQALQMDKTCSDQALAKRGILNYQLKNNDAALNDFTELLNMNDKNCKAHYYKGKAFKKLGQLTDASLHFEQVIKWSADEEQLAGNALFEIAKIRIKQKDFYEAYHNIQRAVHFDFKSRKFLQYKMFLEGVLFIMKRKVKKGVKILTQLVEGSITFDAKEILNSSTPIIIGCQNPISFNNKENMADQQQTLSLNNYLVFLVYVYRSYGHIVLQQLEKALSDLNKASKIRKLNQACIYNKFIVLALIKMDKKDFDGVRQILQQAEEKFPMNKDPYKYQAISIIHQSLSEAVDIDNTKKKEKINEAQAIIDKVLEKHPKDPGLLYLKGLIQFYLHQFYEAIVNLDAVVDIEEEPTAKHFLARGRCHACLSMFQEAIDDLSKAIELDDELSDAYFNRGKCAYLLGDTALAFLDFQKLILLEPKNPMVHIYAGNLLMTTGSYDDATKAFTNADSVQKSSLAFYQRARCHIALANLENALKDLSIVVERSPQDKIAYIDRECLSALKMALSTVATSQNQFTTSAQTVNNNGASPSSMLGYDTSIYEKAAIVYTKLLGTQFDMETNEKMSQQTISVMRMHSQIIPNVKRIKIEKTRALRRKRAKEEYFKNSRKAKRKIVFNYSDETDENLVSQASKIQPFSYYKENIFGPEDFYLYRGVMHFYSGEYKKASQDYKESIKTKQQQKDESGDDNQSQSSSQTDLSDVGLCSLNVHESSYNQILCLIQLREYKQAVASLSDLMKQVPKKYTKQMWLIRGLLFQALGNQKSSQADFEQAMKVDSFATDYLTKKTSIHINPFPVGNRLCSHFQEIKVWIQGAPTYFYCKPSFSFPFVKPPNMIPNVDEKIMQSEFNMKHVAPPKPEAPWIKRCDYGIKFTDEIQVLENPFVSDTEESTTKDVDTQDENHKDGEDQNDDQDSKEMDISNLDERHYLRAYLKQEKEQIKVSVSERVLNGNVNLFMEMDDEYLMGLREHQYQNQYEEDSEEEGEEENIDDIENEEEDDDGRDEIDEKCIQEDLYGKNAGHSSNKNIIVDEDYEEYEQSKEQ